MDLNLRGKVALITGPAKGMGAAITRRSLREGCTLVLAGRDIAAIEPVARTIRRLAGGAIVVSCDLTDTARCQAVAEEAMAAYGGASTSWSMSPAASGPMGKTGWETTPAEFDEIITLNMTGCFNTMRAVLPFMIARREGRIVNVGGTFGMRGRAGRMAYSASKWGLRGITKIDGAGSRPIRRQRQPGGARHGGRDRFRSKVVPTLAAKLGISEDEAVDRHAGEYALRRITVDEDVANACLFLASSVSRQITGVDLPVDGGWAML